MPNDASREVVLKEYDPTWPLLFDQERQRLADLIGDVVVEVHHVGSTSIPGLAAKPIIDVLVLLDRPLTDAEIAAIAAPGYEYRGEQGEPGRQYFRRRTSPAFHLHCFLAENQKAYEMLRFRNYLRKHPETAKEYDSLKHRLAKEFRFERHQYQDAKTEFVLKVLAQADAEVSIIE